MFDIFVIVQVLAFATFSHISN